jgi:hypothetical protein
MSLGQVFVIAQDQAIDRPVAGAKDGGDQVADFVLLGH